MNNITIANGILTSRMRGNALVKTATLLLLMSSFLLEGQATACGTLPGTKSTHSGQTNTASVSHAQKDQSPIDLDYYQSSDNPNHAD